MGMLILPSQTRWPMFVQFMHFRRSGWGLNHHLPSLALFFERPDLELCLLGRKRRLFPDLAQEGFCLKGRFTQRGAPFLISTKEKHFLSGNRPGGKEGQKLLQPPREDRAGPREPWRLGGGAVKGSPRGQDELGRECQGNQILLSYTPRNRETVKFTCTALSDLW